jgi:hypothetical protein
MKSFSSLTEHEVLAVAWPNAFWIAIAGAVIVLLHRRTHWCIVDQELE